MPIKIAPYIYKNVDNLYVFSDVHSDLDALIIILRDCAKVISPNIGTDLMTYKSIAQIDISIEDGLYKEELGYHWSGGNSFVVIIGDILDNLRGCSIRYNLDNGIQKYSPTGCYRSGEYDNEEVKILRFLNIIQAQAILSNGNIIKLFGNHEYENLHTDYFADTMNSPNSIAKLYRGLTRRQIFKHNSPYLNLLGNVDEVLPYGIIARVNDYIFVHGGLSDKIDIKKNLKSLGPIDSSDKTDNMNKIIYYINNKFNNELNDKTKLSEFKLVSDQLNGILWTRENSNETIIHTDLITDRDIPKDGYNKNPKYCKKLHVILNSICRNYCKRLKLVVGHCPQYLSQLDSMTANVTYKNTFKLSDGKTQIIQSSNVNSLDINDHMHRGLPEINTNVHIFGMTADCVNDLNKVEPSSFRLYRVDVGISRAFDCTYFFDSIRYILDSSKRDIIKKNIIYYFLSRSPSVLAIINNPVTNRVNTQIIRSSLKNMFLYQPRFLIDNLPQSYKTEFYSLVDEIDNIFPDYVETRMDPDTDYRNKYLKYKQKYLQLKKIISS